jgi:S-adenosylmethionine/arginine decarboxylase-like enzyme
MKRKGPCKIERFGKEDLKGYSVMQFIETSSVCIHFDEPGKRAFIDIFSCKNFDVKRAENFSKRFFLGKKSTSKTIVRE